MNIEIDTKKINEENDKLKALSEKLKSIEDSLIRETNILKEYWQSNTSEKFYKDYFEFNDNFDKYIEEWNNIVNYLQNIVINGYKEYDENISKTVDENF